MITFQSDTPVRITHKIIRMISHWIWTFWINSLWFHQI